MISPNQLPEDLQASFKKINPSAGMNVLTDTGMPQTAAPLVAPAEMVAPAPAIPQSAGPAALSQNPMDIPTPMTFAQKIGTAADKLGIPTDKPGGWARSLVGAAQQALAGLGDVSTKEGGGPLTGVVETLANRNQRMSVEQGRQDKLNQEQKVNQREDQKLQLEKDRNAALNAYTTAEMVHEQALTHQLGEQAIESSVATGKKMFDAATTGENPAPVLFKDLTSNEIKDMIAKGMLPKNAGMGQPTGRKVVGEDEAGNPKYATTYSLTSDDWTKELDDNTAAFLKEYTPNQAIPAGTVLSGTYWNVAVQAAQNAAAQTAARDTFLINNKLAKADAIEKLDKVNLGPDWTNALSETKGDPFKALDNMLQNEELMAKYPNLAEEVMEKYAGTTAKWEEMKETHYDNGAKAQIERDKLKAKKDEELGDDTGLAMTPETAAKIAALPQPAQEVLAQYGPNTQSALYAVAFGDDDGYRVFPPRKSGQGGGLTTQQAFGIAHQINPNFDPSRAAVYQATRKEFQTGKASVVIPAANTAMAHLADLWDVTNASSTIPGLKNLGSAVGLGDANAALTYAGKAGPEIEKANKGAAGTEGENKKAIDDLIGKTPWAQEQKVKAAAKTIWGRIQSYQHQWEQGSVPGTNPPYELMNQDTVNAFNKIDPTILAGTKWGVQPAQPAGEKKPDQTQQRAQQSVVSRTPTGAAGTAKGSDGKMYYVTQDGRVLGPANQ